MPDRGEQQDDPSSFDVDTKPDLNRLFDSLYSELRNLAGVVFAEQKYSHTLQPTALINEVWIKLAGKVDRINDRPHFFALAAKAMRQVLADHARSNNRIKRGGNAFKLTFSEGSFGDPDTAFDLVDFHDSLEKLGQLNKRQAAVAELRLLGALSIVEISIMLGIHERTAKRDWRIARLWLLDELGKP